MKFFDQNLINHIELERLISIVLNYGFEVMKIMRSCMKKMRNIRILFLYQAEFLSEKLIYDQIQINLNQKYWDFIRNYWESLLKGIVILVLNLKSNHIILYIMLVTFLK
ncbi:unnamed protein product [Blepharisma stoltei]|uniref:Uncharacterized protein n=1 Tax=Blepharisma stoltei TaxID=1481888 RepID=A0AAU9KDG2_9CILI|nr:unnamed protein product [Blepharisma stoltei]